MDTSIQEPDSTYYPSMVSAGILTKEKARELLGYEVEMIGDDKEQQKPEQQDDEKILEQIDELKKAIE